MTNQPLAAFHDLLAQALQLSSAERLAMIEELAASFRSQPIPSDQAPLTPDEIAVLMQVEPLSPAEIEAKGLLGTWADLGITDGAEWVNEQKRKRRERH